MIRSRHEPLAKAAGFVVMTGNLFDTAIMKTSVITREFRERYLSTPGSENVFEGRAIVFEGSEDYHERINEESLGIDERCDPRDPRLRADRLAGLGRGGQHAAPRRADQAPASSACRRSATDGSRAPPTARRS